MADHNCEECKFRAKHDAKPKSILGRIWRFHINFCPGWKGYMKSLNDDEKQTIVERYNLPAGKF
jgi:hypothetical protein